MCGPHRASNRRVHPDTGQGFRGVPGKHLPGNHAREDLDSKNASY